MVIKVPDIRIELIDYTTWVPIQGNLKDLYTDNFERLKNSLKQKGGFVPAFIWLDKGIPKILDAHQRHRLFVAENVEFEHIDGTRDKRYPCVIIEAENLKDAKERLLVISSQYGRMTQEGLDEFAFDIESEFITETTNFDALINFGEEEEPEELETEEDDYEEPEDIQVDVVLGDLIEIGPHRLLCGDSTDSDEWERVMNGAMADLVQTDPPYNVDYTGGTKDALKIKNDKMDDSSFYQFLLDFYTSVGLFVKAGAGWYVWHADSEGHNFRKALIEAGVMVKQCLVWVKNSMVMGRQDYHWKHEPCLYGWKKGAAHNWYSDRKQTTVLEFDRPNRNAEHPTMKPVPLIAYQIKNSTKQGDVVVDGFLGSGTTMVASHQLGRKCYGMELDPKYCQVIIDRMQKLDQDLEVKINGEPYTKNTN